jgi:hypothetical protein
LSDAFEQGVTERGTVKIESYASAAAAK